MKKIGRISYSVKAGGVIGDKNFLLDIFLADDDENFIIRVMITSSKIREFSSRYAIIEGNAVYDFVSVLERATFYSNLIYSFPFKEGSKGGVKMLSIRIDAESEKRQVRGVIALSFFSPVSVQGLSDKDRESVFYYFQPIQLLSISNQIKEILTAYRSYLFTLSGRANESGD